MAPQHHVLSAGEWPSAAGRSNNRHVGRAANRYPTLSVELRTSRKGHSSGAVNRPIDMGRVPRCLMFYLQYRVLPSSGNPRREQLGEGLVCCWIDRPTLRQADRVARRAIQRENWEVLEREFGEAAGEAD